MVRTRRLSTASSLTRPLFAIESRRDYPESHRRCKPRELGLRASATCLTTSITRITGGLGRGWPERAPRVLGHRLLRAADESEALGAANAGPGSVAEESVKLGCELAGVGP